MRPFILEWGPFHVPSFFFFILFGAFLATLYGASLAKRSGLRSDPLFDMGILGVVMALVGCRVFHILVEAPEYYLHRPIKVFYFWEGGFVSWGAVILVPLSLIIYYRVRGLPFWPYTDIVATMAPVIKFFVRTGCLATGCCYGRPTDVPWALTFTDPRSTAHYFFPNTPLHPTQVYGMIGAVAVFVVVNWVYRRQSFAGQTTAVMAMSWAAVRFVNELFRGDADRGLWFGGWLSTGQIMTLIFFGFGAVVYAVMKRRGERRLA